MKVVFICGSIEKGKDGVGDYTLRLSSALSGKGVEVSIIAINDRYVSKLTAGQLFDGEKSIATLRIPKIDEVIPETKGIIDTWIRSFNPDWVSLQFVPFAFHNKGFIHNLKPSLNLLVPNRRLHIMFHELWVGLSTESSFKEKLWGRLQKLLIIWFLKNTKPLLITTQTSLYKQQLFNAGFISRVLPLFSNICNNHQSTIKSGKINEMRFVIFGAIHPSNPFSEFISELSEYGKIEGKKIIITLLGRSDSGAENVSELCRLHGIEIKLLGEQSEESISYLLLQNDFGIATTPLLLVEKSGSVAAMLTHKLPVICLSKKWTIKGLSDVLIPPGVFQYIHGGLRECLREASNYDFALNQSGEALNNAANFLFSTYQEYIIK